MQNNISGPGLGLPYPQLAYPANLSGSDLNVSTNRISLAPGESTPIPAGVFLVNSKYCSTQFLDPITNSWTFLRSTDNGTGWEQVQSDGYNYRIANLTGCVIGAVVTNVGSGYVQASTTVTPSAGNSTWQAIVGGAISTVTTITTITSVGSGYGIPPLVVFDAPPAPGVQAAAYANISGGTVTSLTFISQGAGYTTVPNVYFVTNSADPNIGSITPATIKTTALTGSGSIVAIVCTNSGASVATTMTLTIAGAGTSAAATPIFMQSVTSPTIVSGGGGYGTFTQLTSVGGFQTTAAAVGFLEPFTSFTGFVPRPAQIALALTGTAITSVTTIYDAGLFLTAPSPVPLTNGIVTTVASITYTTGGVSDTVHLQVC